MYLKNSFCFFVLMFFSCLPLLDAQNASVNGQILLEDSQPLGFANIALEGTAIGTTSNEQGYYILDNITPGRYTIVTTFLGFKPQKQTIVLESDETLKLDFTLFEDLLMMDEIVVTGTLKEVNRLESPVPVEVYNPIFFKKNPTPNIYEALQNVNGVRPQLNCQVCNTGDIHVNGLEGPYTMVLIDGMPIVSSLATVYGLSGIPNSLIERMEIVKGPASSLYGSEAIGGLINVITKNPVNAPILSVDLMNTSWGELNVDLGLKVKVSNNVSLLTGINYFNYDNIIDNNDDNFTDVTIQERLSLFQKWNFNRKDNKLFSLAARYYWEDRWGGELDWTEAFRGGNEIYGEAITTERYEFLGQYQLPTVENLMLSFSFNTHNQNSVYGDTPFIADQKIGFGQMTWNKVFGKHDVLVGSALRYTYYDDNTTATGGDFNSPDNEPSEIFIPGIFLQDEIHINDNHKLLLGLRYDFNDVHKSILTPRIAYKLSFSPSDILRINMGTGFRVINLFTEEHAALTGARDVVVLENLNPEKSVNVNVNYIKKIYLNSGSSGSIELSSWYTYFSNVIYPDYDTNPNQIIYKNLEGSARTKGISLNTDFSFTNGLSFRLGGSLMDVTTTENDETKRQILTERFSGAWSVSYKFLKDKLTFDYTGNIYGPMILPTLGELDLRPKESPWWSIQNIQLTYRENAKFEVYAGVKNILNWTPWKNADEPIIARAFDPFDNGVDFDGFGNAVATANNPQALTFDPSYVYAPNQGIRAFLGMRVTLK